MAQQTLEPKAMTTVLREGYDDLMDAATTVAAAGQNLVLRRDEWNADQILAHIILVNAITISAACSATSGSVAAYDNRFSQDTWTIERVVSLADDSEGLRDRIRLQADALCSIMASLSEVELDTLFPTLLLSNDHLLVDDLVTLRSLIDGLANTELPGHALQLRALLAN